MKSLKALSGLLSTVALAACTSYSPTDYSNALSIDDVDAIDNESSRLLGEVYELEARIARNCMESRGFTIHDEGFVVSAYATLENSATRNPLYSWLPTEEQAEKFAFGKWIANKNLADEKTVAGWMQFQAESGVVFAQEENPEFERLGDDYQRDWYYQFFGLSEIYYGLTGTSEDDFHDPVEPCRQVALDRLYNEAQFPPIPPERRDAARLYGPFLDKINRYFVPFSDCLEDLGYGDWNPDEDGTFAFEQYLSHAYHPDLQEDPDFRSPEVRYPAVRSDFPRDRQQQKDWEFTFARNVRSCAVSSGLEDAATRSWRETKEAVYADLESNIFAWHDAAKKIITRGQGILEE